MCDQNLVGRGVTVVGEQNESAMVIMIITIMVKSHDEHNKMYCDSSQQLNYIWCQKTVKVFLCCVSIVSLFADSSPALFTAQHVAGQNQEHTVGVAVLTVKATSNMPLP
jgi:hypothetical protein